MLEIFDDWEKNSDRAPSPPRTFAYADIPAPATSTLIGGLSAQSCIRAHIGALLQWTNNVTVCACWGFVYGRVDAFSHKFRCFHCGIPIAFGFH
jgi:hypothetical protein